MSASQSVLILSGADHSKVSGHLFPGDGKEAAAIFLCSRIEGKRVRLMVKSIHLVPHDECERHADYLVWPGQHIEDCLTEAEPADLSLILVHSHPGGFTEFSPLDDQSDLEMMDSLFLARTKGKAGKMLHGSAIMLPNGQMRARVYDVNREKNDIALVNVVGDELKFYRANDILKQNALAFTESMRRELKLLHAGVIGSSGTGSIVEEQLLRLGFGEITVVDHDVIEDKNLNRILNSTLNDANAKTHKVDIFARTAAAVYPDTIVHKVPHKVGTHEAIRALGEVDVLFCCVDTLNGRDICQRIATALLLPFFDVGVVIPTRLNKSGEIIIQDIQGRIDYIQPAGSTLGTRNVYTALDLAAEELREKDPDEFARRVKEGYMPGIDEEAPSVITVNMRAASMVVQEFVARAFPYRLESNRRYARTMFALASEDCDYFCEDDFNSVRNDNYAAGFASPLLGLPSLGDASWNF